MMWIYALRVLCVSLLSTCKGQGHALFAFFTNICSLAFGTLRYPVLLEAWRLDCMPISSINQGNCFDSLDVFFFARK